MNIPKYIKNQKNVIGFSKDEVYNKSDYILETDRILLSGSDEVYLFLNNLKKKNIDILIKENANFKIFLLSYNSRKTKINLNVEIEANALLKLYSNFIPKNKTSLKVKREFNLAYKSSLILLNNITYNGSFDLFDEVNLNQELANLDIDLLNIGSNLDMINVDQYVNHNAKRTYSQINNWLISDKASKLNYSVNGTINRGKELSNCNQLNKGIILSKNGEIKVEPKLFIDEYNVKASHGAAIGQIDEDQLFYLLSRGLSELQAKNLIISGYINPFINKIKNKRLEKQLITKINRLI
ncbi:MAG: SufD family Fe-S cluster assembly protein [Candidatus Izemoplasmatales bacterium]